MMRIGSGMFTYLGIMRGIALVAALSLAACGGGASGCWVSRPWAQATPDLSEGSGGTNRPEHRGKPHLVLVSLDGFKPAYLEKFELPNLRRVAARGTRARAMNPVFPTLTLPNHYSLVSGVYPETHGMVANSFWDPDRGEGYSLSSEAVADGTWYHAEPIWVTAERQGMVSACFFWPGSEAAIRPTGAGDDQPGIRPTIWNKYDGSVPNEDRVRTVLEWLQMPDERRPHMITLYFSELDSAQHLGPLDDPAVEAAAKSLDHAIGLLFDGLDALPIRDRLYVLITSDHGMLETSREQTIRLDGMIDTTEIERGFSGPVASLHLKDRARAPTIRDQINDALVRGRAYLRQDVPEDFHYRASPRIGDIVVIMEEAWTLAASSQPSTRDVERWGMHGWDPSLPSMHALFLITGPGIRQGAVVPEVHNVDVYPLLTELLDLRPAGGLAGRSGHIQRSITE
jgi:predicted AlkP superfamily pyrophosphatase or phosphodiesterase